MISQLLKDLSNADAVASNEEEVRQILKKVLHSYQDHFTYDGLGSLIVTKKSAIANAPTILFAAHMDEVGFMIRNISEIGMAYLTALGGVEDRAKNMQLVRATTSGGNKIEGILNVQRDSNHIITQMYVDFGFESSEEFFQSGLNIGDIVCFASSCRDMHPHHIVAGKAMDDRAGCFALVQAMLALTSTDLPVNLVAAFTSSEEVGTRGGRLVSQLIAPDVFFAVDVAKHPELDRGFTNHRRLGKGPMLEFYDKTMVPNTKLIRFLEQIAKDEGIQLQRDMFKGGGTDAGTAHLENGGTVSAVLGIPLRYCHDPFSLVNMQDLETLTKFIQAISMKLDQRTIQNFYKF